MSYDSSTSVDPDGKIAIGEVLSATFNVFKDRFLQLYGFSFLGNVPIIIGMLITGNAAPQSDISSISSGLAGVFGGFAIISALLNMCLQGSIAVCVFKVLRNEESNFSECLQKGLSRLGSLFCISLILIALLTLYFVVGSLVIGIAIAAKSTFLIAILGVALVLFGLTLFLSVVVSIPACMIERAGAFESIKRSMQLTKGNRVTIFFILIIVFIILFIVSFVTALLSIFFASGGIISTILEIVTILINTIPTALSFVCFSVIYYELRSVKESFSIEDEADVFD
ncbi:MAG: hypothetical protein LBE31_09040 [Deltaproteobacteria bacterium]|jgi:hypothetical protein|nr:hypothetical protein [Deltaproteobacteria bacterium]